jgi:hypothetical protein
MEAMKLYRDVIALWSRVRPSAEDITALKSRPGQTELAPGALRTQLRRPALQLAMGGVLMVPAAVLMAGSRAESGPEPVSIPRVLAAESGDVSHSSDLPVIAAPMRWAERDVAPPVSVREEAPDWSNAVEQIAGEREEAAAPAPQVAVATFAREFKIPVKLASQIHAAAVAEKIKPRIAFGLVQAESSFRTRAVSPVGAVGLTQLLPSTARWLVPGTTRGDLMKPETNLRVGFKYLHNLINEFDGNVELALTAYNRGPGTVRKLLRRGRDPDNGYADKVMTGSSSRHVRLMNAKFGRGRG